MSKYPRRYSVSVPGPVRDRIRDAARARGMSVPRFVDAALKHDEKLRRALWPEATR